MRPFQEFRLWARRAPVGERAAAGVAALIVVALLALARGARRRRLRRRDLDVRSAARPAAQGPPGPGRRRPPSAGESTDAGGGAGAAVGRHRRRSAPAGGGGAGSARGRGRARRPPAEGCVSPPGAPRAITRRRGAGRHRADARSSGRPPTRCSTSRPRPRREADFEAAIAGINAEGGVACRKLVAAVRQREPGQRGRDDAAVPGPRRRRTCSPSSTPARSPRGRRCSPASASSRCRTSAPSSSPRRPGSSSSRTCSASTRRSSVYRSTGVRPPGPRVLRPGQGLQEARASSTATARGRRSTPSGAGSARPASLTPRSCPTTSAARRCSPTRPTWPRPSSRSSSQGVTHVVAGNFQGDIARFTAHAEQQGFRPKYGFPDEALLSIASGKPSPRSRQHRQRPRPSPSAARPRTTRRAWRRPAAPSGATPTEPWPACRRSTTWRPTPATPATSCGCSKPPWAGRPSCRPPACRRACSGPGRSTSPSRRARTTSPAGRHHRRPVLPGGPVHPDCTCWRVIQPDFRRGLDDGGTAVVPMCGRMCVAASARRAVGMGPAGRARRRRGRRDRLVDGRRSPARPDARLRTAWWCRAARPATSPTAPCASRSAGEGARSLVLRVARLGVDAGTTLALCPLTEAFTPAQGGPMADAPAYDCERSVDAAASGDGTTYTFEVAALVHDMRSRSPSSRAPPRTDSSCRRRVTTRWRRPAPVRCLPASTPRLRWRLRCPRRWTCPTLRSLTAAARRSPGGGTGTRCRERAGRTRRRRTSPVPPPSTSAPAGGRGLGPSSSSASSRSPPACGAWREPSAATDEVSLPALPHGTNRGPNYNRNVTLRTQVRWGSRPSGPWAGSGMTPEPTHVVGDGSGTRGAVLRCDRSRFVSHGSGRRCCAGR